VLQPTSCPHSLRHITGADGYPGELLLLVLLLLVLLLLLLVAVLLLIPRIVLLLLTWCVLLLLTWCVLVLHTLLVCLLLLLLLLPATLLLNWGKGRLLPNFITLLLLLLLCQAPHECHLALLCSWGVIRHILQGHTRRRGTTGGAGGINKAIGSRRVVYLVHQSTSQTASRQAIGAACIDGIYNVYSVLPAAI
jgi:energy-coupling factor transporter transmembrane protein EcfT